MSKHNFGNDVAADGYAEKAGKDQSAFDIVEHIASKKLDDHEWVATAIDGLMSCSDCRDGVTDFARDLADVLTGQRGVDSYFRLLTKMVRDAAYDQAEAVIEREEADESIQKWLGED